MDGTISVDAAEFERLLLSRQLLKRFDDIHNGLRGLYDPAEKIRYVIREEQLFPDSQHIAGQPVKSIKRG